MEPNVSTEVIENQTEEDNSKDEQIMQYFTYVSESSVKEETPENVLYITYGSDENDYDSSDMYSLKYAQYNLNDFNTDVVQEEDETYNANEQLINVSSLEPIILPDGTPAYLATNGPEEMKSSEVRDETVFIQRLQPTSTKTNLDNEEHGTNECTEKEGQYQQIKLSNGTYAIVELKVLHSMLGDENGVIDADDPTLESQSLYEICEKSKKRNKSFQCPYEGCRKLYATTHHLKVHERTHTGDRPFKCEHPGCNKAFATTYSLKTHFRIHTGEKPYQCQTCSKPFTSSGDLQKHNRIHTGERPFACYYEGCGQAFTTSNIRKVHLRTHTGERPYKCDLKECGKKFASATNYKNHMRIHSGEKPFACKENGCTKRFTEYSSLYKHQIVHKDNKQNSCGICGRVYRQESVLNQHMKTVHRDVSLNESKESTLDAVAVTRSKKTVPKISYTGGSSRKEMVITNQNGKQIQINSREELSEIIKALATEPISNDDKPSHFVYVTGTGRNTQVN